MKKKLNENGQVIIFTTLAFVVLGFFVGMATDGGRGFLLKSELTRTVDAAAVAAASRFHKPSDLAAAEDAACDAARMNGVINCSSLVVTPVTANDAAGNPKEAIQVTGTASTPTIFIRLGNLMGCGNCDVINVQASAVAATGGLVDLAVNLDNTGSMAGAKIANAKIGANALVDALLPTSGSSTSLMTMVPFQGCYHTTPGSPSGSSGCVDSNDYPTSGGMIVPLENDRTRLHNGINALTAPGGSGTNVCNGLRETRIRLFSTGGSHPARPNALKFMIQLTDAENNWNSAKATWVYSGASGIGCRYTGTSTNTDVQNRDLGVRTAALAANIKNPTVAADGQAVGQTVKIFVIMYGPNATGTVPTCNASALTSGTPTSASYTKNLASCIASTPGDVYLAPNATDISAAFQQIINRLPVLLLN